MGWGCPSSSKFAIPRRWRYNIVLPKGGIRLRFRGKPEMRGEVESPPPLEIKGMPEDRGRRGCFLSAGRGSIRGPCEGRFRRRWLRRHLWLLNYWQFPWPFDEDA